MAKDIIAKIIATVAVFVFSSGFAGTGNYTYEEIAEENRDVMCSASDNIVSLAGKPGKCSLSSGAGLVEAIRIALANNPEIGMTEARIKKADAMRTIAESALWPKARVYGEYSQGDAPSGYLFKTIDQRQLPPDTNFNDPGSFENYETGVTAAISLYRGGQDAARLKMASAEQQISRHEQAGTKNRIVASVINAYFNVFSAREFSEIAHKSSDTVKEQLKIMQVRYAGGSALKSDILSLKVRAAQADEEIAKSENRIQMAEAALKKNMGLPLETAVDLRATSLPEMNIPENYEQAVTIAISKRPELETARKRVIQARLSQDAAKGMWMPRVDLDGKLYADYPDTGFDNEDANWMIAVTASWELFTGFYRKGESDKAKAELYETLAGSRQALMDIQLDVKNAYLLKAESEQRLKVAESSVAMADESFALVKQQYEGGSADITRYIVAELDRNSSYTRKTAAYYDREKAMAETARATGLLAGFFSADGGKKP